MKRLHALDALRGALALVVVVHHILQLMHHVPLLWVAQAAVWCFFAMSGYVLAYAYDRRPVAFVIKRIIRLWPLYAVCLCVGWAMRGQLPPLVAFAALHGGEPIMRPNPPDWSLYIELWMAPVLPFMFAVVRCGRIPALLMTSAAFALPIFDAHLTWCGFFAAGCTATVYDIWLPRRMPAPLLWLGKVSYSLYLTHWLVLNGFFMLFGPWGLVPGVALVLPVAWAAWWAIERPSIILSRLTNANSAAKSIQYSS